MVADLREIWKDFHEYLCMYMYMHIISNYNIEMKSTEVQTLGKVALHATTACTEDARLKYCWLPSTSLQEVVICLVLHVSGSRYARVY